MLFLLITHPCAVTDITSHLLSGIWWMKRKWHSIIWVLTSSAGGSTAIQWKRSVRKVSRKRAGWLVVGAWIFTKLQMALIWRCQAASGVLRGSTGDGQPERCFSKLAHHKHVSSCDVFVHHKPGLLQPSYPRPLAQCQSEPAWMDRNKQERDNRRL